MFEWPSVPLETRIEKSHIRRSVIEKKGQQTSGKGCFSNRICDSLGNLQGVGQSERS